MGGSFTDDVRQELAHQPLEGPGAVAAELAGLLRTAGSLTLRGGSPPQPILALRTPAGAVARRTHQLVLQHLGSRPELQVRTTAGPRHEPRYAVQIVAGAATLGQELGLLDERGLPRDGIAEHHVAGEPAALLRGALLGGGSISAPGRPAHLEIAVADPASARSIATAMVGLLDREPTMVDGERRRLVLKSGETIGGVLLATGATQCYLAHEERRLRRQLRGDATRLANADRANLGRSTAASSAQIATVQAAIARVGWDGLPDDVRPVALARLANPEASLTELGGLLDPPIGKSAVHRRFKRIEALATEDHP